MSTAFLYGSHVKGDHGNGSTPECERCMVRMERAVSFLCWACRAQVIHDNREQAKVLTMTITAQYAAGGMKVGGHVRRAVAEVIWRG